MKEVEFNLLEEPWIRVLCPDCSVQEVSLTQALLQAHEYTDLAGELPTQDVAVLRLLLAVLHAVFGRVDMDGQPVEITNTTTAVCQWKSLWKLGKLPEKPIRDYLAKWHDRFWLFHPRRPFWQVPEAKIGIDFDAQKLNGEVSQSGNTARLFASYSGTEKESVSYAAAARWLLYINGYDERGGRPKAGNKPRPGVAWLGQIGFVAVKGKTLYETLMKNFVLLQDGEKTFTEPNPIWEQVDVKSEQSTEIPMPTDAAQMLTLQSRRIILKREKGRVIGHILVGGDFIQPDNAFAEQMTIWKNYTKNGLTIYSPRLHDTTKQMWREFPTLFEGREPGMVRWNVLLQLKGAIPRRQPIVLWGVANQYDSQGASVKDAYSDTLSFHLALVSELGYKQSMVIDEIHRCEKLATAVGRLASDLAKAAGSHADAKTDAVEQFYFQIDVPFRQWLYSIDPDWDGEQSNTSRASWRDQAQRIVRDLGRNLVEQSGPAAFIGRSIDGKEKNKQETQKLYYAAPKAYNVFLARVHEIYQEEGGA